MHSFFCREIPGAGCAAALEKNESEHLFRTLRARKGDLVRFFDGRGASALVEIGQDRLLTVKEKQISPEPPRKLHLYCASPRRNKLDVLLKQAAELGVWSIHLVRCEFSVAEPENCDRMNALLLEGCKQSGNPFLPRLFPPVGFAEAVALAERDGCSGCFGDVERNCGEFAPQSGDVAYFVGPEGGFSEAEQKVLRAHFSGLNLGPYILRLETASVAGIAVLRRVCHV